MRLSLIAKKNKAREDNSDGAEGGGSRYIRSSGTAMLGGKDAVGGVGGEKMNASNSTANISGTQTQIKQKEDNDNSGNDSAESEQHKLDQNIQQQPQSTFDVRLDHPDTELNFEEQDVQNDRADNNDFELDIDDEADEMLWPSSSRNDVQSVNDDDDDDANPDRDPDAGAIETETATTTRMELDARDDENVIRWEGASKVADDSGDVDDDNDNDAGDNVVGDNSQAHQLARPLETKYQEQKIDVDVVESKSGIIDKREEINVELTVSVTDESKQESSPQKLGVDEQDVEVLQLGEGTRRQAAPYGSGERQRRRQTVGTHHGQAQEHPEERPVTGDAPFLVGSARDGSRRKNSGGGGGGGATGGGSGALKGPWSQSRSRPTTAAIAATVQKQNVGLQQQQQSLLMSSSRLRRVQNTSRSKVPSRMLLRPEEPQLAAVQLLREASDVTVKPIVGNPSMSRPPVLKFNPRLLPFANLSVEQVEAMEPEELWRFLSQVYRALSLCSNGTFATFEAVSADSPAKSDNMYNNSLSFTTASTSITPHSMPTPGTSSVASGGGWGGGGGGGDTSGFGSLRSPLQSPSMATATPTKQVLNILGYLYSLAFSNKVANMLINSTMFLLLLRLGRKGARRSVTPSARSKTSSGIDRTEEPSFKLNEMHILLVQETVTAER